MPPPRTSSAPASSSPHVPALLRFWKPWLLLACTCSLALLVWTFVLYPFQMLAHLSQDPPLQAEKSWHLYEPFLRASQTPYLSPEFLGALLHTLSQGRSWTQSSWRIRLRETPRKIIAPTRKGFGVMSLSQEDFVQAQRYCIRRQQIVVRKSWYMLGGCGLTWLKTRASAKDSIELAAAAMHLAIHKARHLFGDDGTSAAPTLSATAGTRHQHTQRQHMSLQKRRENFAAIHHLCGPVFARKYLTNHGTLKGLHSCDGTHIAPYLAAIHHYKKELRALKEATLLATTTQTP